MACRGLHLAIDNEQYRALLEIDDAQTLIELIFDDITPSLAPHWQAASDKAWDAIHRALGDGSLNPGGGPLCAVVLGGQQLHPGNDYIVSLLSPPQVTLLANALREIDRDALQRGYQQIDPSDYDGNKGEADFDYTWQWFASLPPLFARAADQGRGMLFVVDL